MKGRFVESELPARLTLESMLDEVLVVCTLCDSQAIIAPRDTHANSPFAPRRLVCGKCGLVKDWAGKSLRHSSSDASPADPYFQLPLWLRASCCNHVLWFFNRRHMLLVEQYVAADFREARKHPRVGWHNGSLFNRLPKFVKEAGHRDEVLRAIEKLREKG